MIRINNFPFANNLFIYNNKSICKNKKIRKELNPRTMDEKGLGAPFLAYETAQEACRVLDLSPGEE